MEIDSLRRQLQSLQSVKSYFDQDISHLSTMRLKSRGHYITISKYDEIEMVLQILRENKIEYKLIGWGANQILPKDASKWVYLKLLPPTPESEYFKNESDPFVLPAGLGLNTLITVALKRGYVGWEVLTGIPASVGGATYMNAGTKFGDISSIIYAVEILDKTGLKRKVVKDKHTFGYRKNFIINKGDIITHVHFIHHGINVEAVSKNITEYMDYRKKTQPLQSNNCGCIFKNMNNISAGKIIDELNLKGVCVGPLKISTVHGNFIENTGGGTADQFWELVSIIQEKVKEKTGKEFELEICS